jgi:hypothetical protein
MWGCDVPDIFGADYRACLLDSCGQPLWNRDVEADANPSLSRTGTVAFIKSTGDSVHVRFISVEGHHLGTWATLSDSLGAPGLRRVRAFTREFLPRSDRLVILSVRTPRNLAIAQTSPALRLVSASEGQLWSRDLMSQHCNELYLSDSGSLIVAYGPIAYANSGEAVLQEHELQVFNVQGRRIAHILGHGEWELSRVIIDLNDRFLYYDSGVVRAIDLVTGQQLPEPPEGPLASLAQSDDPLNASRAAMLLVRLKEQASAGKDR